jgi:excisionase family DNA binding protein
MLIRPGTVLLSGEACAALASALADPARRASLPPAGGQAASAILAAGRAWERARATSGPGTIPAPRTPDPSGSSHEELDGVASVASRLGCSPRWVRALAERGDLRGRRVGPSWVFRREDVAEYLRQREAG